MATWTVEDNQLVTGGMPRARTSFVSEPLPPWYWTVSNNKLKTVGMPDLKYFGAFANAVYLHHAIIPESVATIGEYAFNGTDLASVTISDQCIYSSTSFPQNCIIKNY